MSTEHSFPVVLEMSTEQLLAVVRFAYSQVVRNGWSKQDCTSYLTLIGFSRFACDTVYNYIVGCVAFDMIAWNADRPERSEFLRSYSRVEDNSVWIYPFLRSYSRVENNSVWITGYYSKRCVGAERRCVGVLSDRPERNYSRQYRNEAMHNTYLGHLRYFWEGPCESNIPNRLRLGMIERSISSDDGGVDDASDEGYTDGLYPDFPKRWRKKEELAFEGGVQGGFVHEDNIKQKDRPTDVLAITSSGEEDRPNLLMYENRLNENRLFEILNELFTSFGYASPSPNEPWVYNEDSDDDSLPDLSDSFEILNGNDRLLSYASPNPNEAPVYNEDDSNGDSDDDSLPELS